MIYVKIYNDKEELFTVLCDGAVIGSPEKPLVGCGFASVESDPKDFTLMCSGQQVLLVRPSFQRQLREQGSDLFSMLEKCGDSNTLARTLLNILQNRDAENFLLEVEGSKPAVSRVFLLNPGGTTPRKPRPSKL